VTLCNTCTLEIWFKIVIQSFSLICSLTDALVDYMATFPYSFVSSITFTLNTPCTC